MCDRDGNTPLHIACRIGFVEGVATLVGRTNHINAEACRIPELNIRNSKGYLKCQILYMYMCTRNFSSFHKYMYNVMIKTDIHTVRILCVQI